jgi:hypothetical protein
MRTLRKVLVFLAVVAAAIALIVWVARPNEPSYGGRSLTEWLELYNTSERDTPAEREAAGAVRAIGTNALPCLLRWIQYEPIGRAHPLLRGVRKSPQVVQKKLFPLLLSTRRAGQSHAAVIGFKILGSEARPAIPELTRLLNATNSPYASQQAALALGGMGKEGLPPLIAGLGNSRNRVRHVVANVLGNMGYLGREAAPAVPALLNALQDTDPRVRIAATNALESLAPEVRGGGAKSEK